MKYFLLCAIDQPKIGEWNELGEFLLSENEKEIQTEFEAAVVDGEYPYLATGSISAEGVARMDVSYFSPPEAGEPA